MNLRDQLSYSYNTSLSILLEEENKEYFLMFKFAYPDQKSVYLNNHVTLSPKQKKEIDKLRYSKTIKDVIIGPPTNKDDVTGELYTVEYSVKGKPTINFSYLSKTDLSQVESRIKKKKIKDEDLKIKKTTYNELLSILKRVRLNNQYTHKLINKNEFTNIIDKIGQQEAEKKRDISAEKKSEKKQQKDAEVIGKPGVTPQEIPEFSKEERIEGAKFFTDDINDLLSSIIQAHAIATNLNNPPKDIIDAKKDRYERVNLFVDKLKEFTKEENLIKVIFQYFLNIKIPKNYKSVYSYILAAYEGTPIDSIKKEEPTTKTTKKSKSSTKKGTEKKQDIDNKVSKDIPKPDAGEKKYKFELTIVDPKGDNYIAEKKLTISQAKEIDKVAQENLKKYNNYQKKLDSELKKMQSNPGYAPNIDLNADFGIIGVKLKSEISEMSATGTGAAVSPGEGEGVATKYAFAGAGGTKAKRKKGIVQSNSTKIIKTDESYRIKNDAKFIFWESVRWLINNK